MLCRFPKRISNPDQLHYFCPARDSRTFNTYRITVYSSHAFHSSPLVKPIWEKFRSPWRERETIAESTLPSSLRGTGLCPGSPSKSRTHVRSGFVSSFRNGLTWWFRNRISFEFWMISKSKSWLRLIEFAKFGSRNSDLTRRIGVLVSTPWQIFKYSGRVDLGDVSRFNRGFMARAIEFWKSCAKFIAE